MIHLGIAEGRFTWEQVFKSLTWLLLKANRVFSYVSYRSPPVIYFFLFIKIPIHPHNRPLTRDAIRMVWTQNSCNHNKMLLCKSVKHELNLRRLFKASRVLFDQNLSEPKKIEITVADILRSSLKCCTVAWLCSQTWHSVMAKPIKKYFTEDTEQVNHHYSLRIALQTRFAWEKFYRATCNTCIGS